MPATIYHNPRCSKSRQALELLEKNKLEFDVRNYIKEPLSKAELKNLLKALQLSAHELIRSKEPEYKTLGLSDKSSEAVLVDAMINFPKLIERPIVVTKKGARIGRPTENILEIL